MTFQRGDIMIDTAFARFGAKSYAIDKINSVEVRHRKKGGVGLAVTLLLLALFLFAGSQWLLGCLVLLGSGWLFWASTRDIYTLVLTTSSQEAQAMQTENADEIIALKDALEAAMIARNS